MIVKLERGSKGIVEWNDPTKMRAIQRAFALCELHNCTMTQMPSCIVVHASAWYQGRCNDENTRL